MNNISLRINEYNDEDLIWHNKKTKIITNK